MKIIDIEPTEGHILVELYEKPSEVGGLIIVGDQQNNAPVRGKVLRTAPNGSPYEIGETIFFRKYAIDELKFIGENASEEVVYLVDEREILGVVRTIKDKVKDKVFSIFSQFIHTYVRRVKK